MIYPLTLIPVSGESDFPVEEPWVLYIAPEISEEGIRE
jgi:hypothetical protein